MTVEQIAQSLHDLEGVVVLAPQPGSEYPEIAWGDSFYYYAPGGQVPANVQPFTTVVTKDYPDDVASRLDEEGRRRLNIRVDREAFIELTGEEPHDLRRPRDFAAADVVLPHPIYASSGWVAIVNPGPATTSTALGLVRNAYDAARARYERRRDT